MAQKYKVFFFGNVLVFTNNPDLKRKTTILYKYTDRDDFKSFLFDFIEKKEKHHVRIMCGNIEKCWADFNSMFEVRRASGGLVTNADGNFLFIKRKGFWDIPKGHIEPGETSECGALREVEEECGISGMQIDKLICTTYHTYWLDGKPILKSTDWYLMEYNGSASLTPQTDEDITEAVWAKPEDIDKLLENSFSSIPEVIKQYRKHLD